MPSEQMYELRLAWWFIPYCTVLGFFCQVADDEPKGEHLQWIVQRAIRIVPCSE